ncbi:MAG: bifunctional phosphoribosyl-AMP cyclohydrolase/phosphoribosyl-ATP diphosphatase HisIE [Candidatus Desulforudis sp.]|nr:bifunctional phosphoribosyl-AMP cyclohydrolase/phosphoribosyl-ATP diphosphatase HisIE [Desulforudis sp.]
MGFNFDKLKFDKDGLVPAVIQDTHTHEVLMMAWMNQEAIEKILTTGETWFWSRSRQKLWHKGETSGHVQQVDEMYHDCDADTLLIKVRQAGAACHEGYRTCFHYRVDPRGGVAVVGEMAFDPDQVYGGKPGPAGPVAPKPPKRVLTEDEFLSSCGVLEVLYAVIQDRKEKRPTGAYTTYLFDKGLDKILKKVGEETTEVIVGAKNNLREEVIHEVADLFYHVLVLLAEKNVHLDDVLQELQSRRK